MGSCEIRVNLPRGMNARRSLKLRDSLAVTAEVKVDCSKILITAEAVGGQRNCLAVHVRGVIEPSATQVKVTEPIVILEIVRPKLNCVQEDERRVGKECRYGW